MPNVDLLHTYAVVLDWNPHVVHLASSSRTHDYGSGGFVAASYCGHPGVVLKWKFTPEITQLLLDGAKPCDICFDLMGQATAADEDIPF